MLSSAERYPGRLVQRPDLIPVAPTTILLNPGHVNELFAVISEINPQIISQLRLAQYNFYFVPLEAEPDTHDSFFALTKRVIDVLAKLDVPTGDNEGTKEQKEKRLVMIETLTRCITAELNQDRSPLKTLESIEKRIQQLQAMENLESKKNLVQKLLSLLETIAGRTKQKNSLLRGALRLFKKIKEHHPDLFHEFVATDAYTKMMMGLESLSREMEMVDKEAFRTQIRAVHDALSVV